MTELKNWRIEDRDYRHAYADELLNTMVRTQIRVLREQRGMSQGDLARQIGTTQTAISRLENVNYSSWNILEHPHPQKDRGSLRPEAAREL